MATGKGLLNPHTGQPVEWEDVAGLLATSPGLQQLLTQAGVGGIDWQQALMRAEGGANRGLDSRAAELEQALAALDLSQLDGYKTGGSRKDYETTAYLMDPQGEIASQFTEFNKGPSWHSEDWKNAAQQAATIWGGGALAAAGGAAGLGNSLYGLNGAAGAAAGGATAGGGFGGFNAALEGENVLKGAAKGALTGGAVAGAGSLLGDYASGGTGQLPGDISGNWGSTYSAPLEAVGQIDPLAGIPSMDSLPALLNAPGGLEAGYAGPAPTSEPPGLLEGGDRVEITGQRPTDTKTMSPIPPSSSTYSAPLPTDTVTSTVGSGGVNPLPGLPSTSMDFDWSKVPWQQGLGAVLGYLSSKDQTQTQNREPWGPAQPWIKDNIASGQALQAKYTAQPFNEAQRAGYQNMYGLLNAGNQMAPQFLLNNNALMQGYDRMGGAGRSRVQGLTGLSANALPPSLFNFKG